MQDKLNAIRVEVDRSLAPRESLLIYEIKNFELP